MSEISGHPVPISANQILMKSKKLIVKEEFDKAVDYLISNKVFIPLSEYSVEINNILKMLRNKRQDYLCKKVQEAFRLMRSRPGPNHSP